MNIFGHYSAHFETFQKLFLVHLVKLSLVHKTPSSEVSK